MQYLSQSFRIKYPEIKDLFLDIGITQDSKLYFDLSTPGPEEKYHVVNYII